MWDRFRDQVLPRHVGFLRRVIGREVPLEIDWKSLGEEPGLDESLDYDLEMLGRGLEGLEAHSPFRDERLVVEAGRLTAGIERIRVRRVERPPDCRLVVEGGTLHVDFLGTGTGSFSAREVETLLLDRESALVGRWLVPPTGPLPPELEEVRRNRIPARIRGLHAALGREIPLRVSWNTLAGAPDAASRLLHLLDEAVAALRGLAREDPGIVVGPESVRERARSEASERGRTVRSAIGSVHVGGGSLADGDACRLDGNELRLTVFRDTVYVPRGSSGPPRPVTYFSHLPGVSSREMREVLLDSLDLEVGPLLRRVRAEDHPKAAEHLLAHLDRLVGDCSRLDLRERMRLRKLLESRPVRLEVDWESLTSIAAKKDRLSCLQKIETGHYNYNRHYGELFKELFFAIEEAFSRGESFPEHFLERVRVIRYSHVPEPAMRELLAEGGTLVLRQCLLEPGGVFGDYSELASLLLTVVESMTQPVEPGRIEGGLERIAAALGGRVEVRLGPGLLEIDPVSLGQRVIRPLVGAVGLLLEDTSRATAVRDLVLEFEIDLGEPPRCALQGATLLYHCRPDRGPAGCLAGEDLVRALDDALGLRVRAEIREMEREEHDRWEGMLRERFHRELPVEVDWETFLAHPEQGCNRLYPLHVKEAGVMRLIYALNGWMDEDEEFRERAGATLEGLLVTCAPDAESAAVDLDGAIVVYRCHADMGLQGFLTIDHLQMRLGELIL